MGRRQWGEGFSVTTIKDTWTKPKGEGGSRGGRWIWLGGVGKEQWGEGITGTTIKATWTKLRGSVEAGEGGGFGWGGMDGWGKKCRKCN